MKVIFSDFLYPYHAGGVAKHVYYVVDHLLRSKTDFICLSRGGGGAYETHQDEAVQDGVVLMKQIGGLKFWITAFKAIKGSDNIVCHYVVQGVVVALMTFILRKRFKFFFHGPIDEEYFEKKGNRAGALIRRWAQVLVLHRASKIFVHSRFMEKKLVSKARGVSDKVELVQPFKFPCNAKRSSRLELTEVKALASMGAYLLVARRLTPRTGVLDLCRFIADMGDDYDLPPVLITGEGEDKGEILKISQITTNVIFVGHVSEGQLSYLIDNAVATLLPTKSLEGLGYIIIEAMQRGVPAIVSSTCGGGADYVGSKFPDLIYELDDYRSLAAAVASARTYSPSDFKSHVSAHPFEAMVQQVYG